MSQESPPPLPHRNPPPIRTYYFAFGSNLSLSQMARRCPNSKYIGRATLRHYQWIINQRGYANVVPSTGDWVEGLIFEIDGEDERRLDKNEGIAKQLYISGDSGPIAPCYRKEYKSLKVHRAQKALYRRPVSWIVQTGGVGRVLSEAEMEGGSVRRLCSMLEENVLVYASPDFVKPGRPKEEYVKRINSGVQDARALGMTQEYIERFIRRSIPPDGQATIGSKAYPVMQENQTRTGAGADACRGHQRVQGGDLPSVQQRGQSLENAQVQDRARGRNSEHRPSTSSGPRSHSQSARALEQPLGEGRLQIRSLSLRRGEERRPRRVPVLQFGRWSIKF